MFLIEGRRLGSIEDRRRIRSWFRIPDWRDASEYPSQSASGDRWAWEFLRRNNEFTSALNTVCRQIARLPRERRTAAHPLYAQHEELLIAWGIDHWYPRAWRWGWPSGQNEQGSHLFLDMNLDAPCGFVAGVVDSSRHLKRPLTGSQYAVIFDAEMPIAPQLAQVRAALEYRQSLLPSARRTVRPRWSLLPRYLRTFDGFQELSASGLSEAQAIDRLANHFSLEKIEVGDADYVQDARNALDAARRYIELDYRILPIMKGYPSSS